MAAIAIVRILIAAVFGAPLLPVWPGPGAVAGQPGAPAAGLGRIAGVLIAVLDVVFWAAIVISLIWLVVALLGCMGGFHFPRLG